MRTKEMLEDIGSHKDVGTAKTQDLKNNDKIVFFLKAHYLLQIVTGLLEDSVAKIYEITSWSL